MSNKKEHSVMGLPRAGKRRWSGDDDDEEVVDGESPPKILCTSPPYGLCAEDVLPHPTPTPDSHRLSSGGSVITETMDECEITRLSPEDNDDLLASSDSEDVLLPQYDEREEDENFIDDEEDKDSGFIDGNSIDNSSDDDCDAKGDSSFTSTSSQSQHPHSSSISTSAAKEESLPETDFQISLAKVLSSSSSSSSSTSSSSTSSSSQEPTTCTCITCTTNSCSSVSITLQDSSSIPSKALEVREYSDLTTVTSAQTSSSTIVTSAYQGSVPSPCYDLHTYQSVDTSELYQSRPCTPSWSCTFYDGSQPTTTNKYMEISPNRTLAGQSIQCDENGKSYLELGSASPYPNNYSAGECGNFTPTPPAATYNNSSYAQTPPPSYPSGTGYFNNRPHYSPNSPYGYHGPEGYNTYEEGGCSYGYINGVYSPHNPGRGGPGVPNRIQPQRCSSPICDPTRTSPRPACYPQQRLSVLNLSMFKLNRFSRFPEPSLHRSVLICNTLRHIEREMEGEGLNMAAILSQPQNYGIHTPVGPPGPPPNGVHCPESLPSMPSTNNGEGPLPSIHSPIIGLSLHPPLHSATLPPSTQMYSSDSPAAYSHVSPYSHDSRDSPIPFDPLRENLPLRSFSPPPSEERHGLLTSSEALPHEEDMDTTSSRLCEDRPEGSINWCSVLSLSSQTDLDSMNNNECHEWNNEEETTATLTTLTSRGSSSSDSSSSIQYASEGEVCLSSSSSSSTPNWKLPSLSADDVLKSFPEPPRRSEEDLDSIIKVLVGS